jgi:hypothetical protein
VNSNVTIGARKKGPRAWGCRLGAWGLWAEGRRIFLRSVIPAPHHQRSSQNHLERDDDCHIPNGRDPISHSSSTYRLLQFHVLSV